MTRAEAIETEKRLKATGVFTKVSWDEFGFGSGNFRVYVKIEDRRVGNGNMSVYETPLNEKQAMAAAKEAKAKARETDARTRANIQADRQNQY